MKILTWNCNGAFRKKFPALQDFDADLYVIQECENPLETKDKNYHTWAENHLWIGDRKHKGVAIFAKPEIELTKLDWPNLYEEAAVKYFLPCSVNQEFILLAVWAHQNNAANFAYIGQLWRYLQLNKHQLNNVIISGDFNSNAIWDRKSRWWNHSDVVRELDELGVNSFYHHFLGEEHGRESQATFYLQKKAEKTYHLDYVFGAQSFLTRLKKIEIGQIEQWLSLSDHMPIFCELE